MEEKSCYFTTTLPYVNAEPHLGFALELVQADTIARFRKLSGCEVFLNTGTDEHGLKIYRKAEEAGESPQAYADRTAERFRDLVRALGVDLTRFVRTTDPDHKRAAQEFWKRCEKNGDIYKGPYSVTYCVGCELEKTDSELEDGKCPVHPNLVLEKIEEENYFFRFSKYQDALLELYKERPDFVLPSHRLKEISNFVEGGLRDFSISRLKSKMPWGVPVPGDEEQVMYVWFDALVNYISTLGWPDDEASFKRFWPGVQFAGKDNLRQQSAMWQAMLMSAGLPPSRQIMIHGFLTSAGAKMSKSLGNVVSPFDLVDEYGTDALRFWLLKEMPTFEDGDFTPNGFREAYNAYLANGLGNLTARIMKMAADHGVRCSVTAEKPGVDSPVWKRLESFDIQGAVNVLWERIGAQDAFIAEKQPFRVVKEDPEKGKADIQHSLDELWRIGSELAPFMPDTSAKILEAIGQGTVPEILFPRK